MAVDDTATKSLLHFNGSDASTTFTDESGKTWSATGNAQLDTAQIKFGSASGLFDGTGDYISTADHADWVMGTNNFTIDFWVRFNALPTTGGASNGQYLLSQPEAGSKGMAVLYWVWDGDNTNRRITFMTINGGTIYVWGEFLLSLSVNTWYHLAFIRNGSNFRIYSDGVSLGDVTDSDSIIDFAASLLIGNSTQGVYGIPANSYFNGWIDEFRWSNGLARWTANFYPPGAEYLPKVPPMPSLNQTVKRSNTY